MTNELFYICLFLLIFYVLINIDCNITESYSTDSGNFFTNIFKTLTQKYTGNSNEQFALSGDTSQGQFVLSDPVGNLSTFNFGTGNTLVSDSSGNVTTIQTGQFSVPINTSGGLTSTTGTFSGALNANGGLTSTTGTFSGAVNSNGGISSTTGSFSGAVNANGGISSTTGAFSGAVNVNGGLSSTTGAFSGAVNVNGNINTSGTISGKTLCVNGTCIPSLNTSGSIQDTRSINSMPNDYRAMGVGQVREFKTSGAISLPSSFGTFSYLITYIPWGDTSGGGCIQEAFDGYSNYKAIRHENIGSNIWGGWIFTGGNVNITNNWQNTANTTTSEISNDTNSFKTLMVIGNSSGGGGTRRVGVWDELDVNGNLKVTPGGIFCIGSTCISENDLKKVQKLSGGFQLWDNLQGITKSSAKGYLVDSGNPLWSNWNNGGGTPTTFYAL